MTMVLTTWIAISCCALPITMLISMIIIDSEEDWPAMDLFLLWPALQLIIMVVSAILVRW